jgi:hypothetical protein
VQPSRGFSRDVATRKGIGSSVRTRRRGSSQLRRRHHWLSDGVFDGRLSWGCTFFCFQTTNHLGSKSGTTAAPCLLVNCGMAPCGCQLVSLQYKIFSITNRQLVPGSKLLVWSQILERQYPQRELVRKMIDTQPKATSNMQRLEMPDSIVRLFHSI